MTHRSLYYYSTEEEQRFRLSESSSSATTTPEREQVNDSIAAVILEDVKAFMPEGLQAWVWVLLQNGGFARTAQLRLFRLIIPFGRWRGGFPLGTKRN